MMKMDKLLIEHDGPIGWLTFNNPQRRNAISFEMWKAIPGIIERFNNDDSVRVIVLKGAGEEAFASGADISEFKEMRRNMATSQKYNQATLEGYNALKNSAKPLIAMIRGFCIGGGCAVALQCDIRIASECSKFGIPAAKLGLAYGFAGIKQLVDVVGPSYTREMLYTGMIYNADDALKMGLVQHCVKDNELESVTIKYAQTIANNAPLTIRSIKIAIDEYLKSHDNPDMKRIEHEMARCFDSQDYQEGYHAFLEKRKPKFQGK